MNRYMLFGYADYYPQGGMNDYHGSFDSIKEARDFFVKQGWSFDRTQIYDIQEDRLVVDE